MSVHPITFIRRRRARTPLGRPTAREALAQCWRRGALEAAAAERGAALLGEPGAARRAGLWAEREERDEEPAKRAQDLERCLLAERDASVGDEQRHLNRQEKDGGHAGEQARREALHV